ncbi:hypothetical protein [Rubrivirga marina]|jgi:hypothetical protein|uniref:STAS/SEC14 domain-containing protein n=1 Tax=Rubrivirga marina TaxID=1196024 RepID=A0A271IVF5_9BACT|nr:hypothetical protein [Rubrivirga marina]PAP74539.1 hypothetical protein BSZ37_20370 [Rubrivirga marina]
MPPEKDHPVAVFPDRRFGLVQPWGDVSAESALRAARTLVDHPEWEPGFTEVWDLRFAGRVVVEPPAAERFRAFEADTRDRLAGSRTVFVTDHRPLLTYGVRFYAQLVQPLGREVVACRTEEEAVRYLDGESIPRLGSDKAA